MAVFTDRFVRGLRPVTERYEERDAGCLADLEAPALRFDDGPRRFAASSNGGISI